MNSPYSNHKLPSIHNKYKEISLLGKGSYGSVYLVKDIDKDIYYADKRIKLMGRNHYEKNSILNEIRLLSCHNSPHIIKLYDVYITTNTLHLITEYAAKGDLSKIVKRYRRTGKYFTEDKIKSYLFQICMGIQYLHQNNIMHRDIKSANIFMTKKYSIKIGDVGIIKVLSPTVDYTRTKIGTPYYMSPEVYKHQRYNSKTDVWSIGVLLYEMMTLKLPYDANNMAQLQNKISNENWYLEDKYRSKFSNGLCDILTNMLNTNPAKRYTLTEVLQHPYLKNLYDTDNKISSEFEPSFYVKSPIPSHMGDWNRAIHKYAKPAVSEIPKSNPNLNCKIPPLPKHCTPKVQNPPNIIPWKSPMPNSKIPHLNPVIHNPPPFYFNNNSLSKSSLVKCSNMADQLIQKTELLIQHIVAYRYEKYYSLKQEIKRDVQLYKILLSSNT
jgi:NIMA (never in mitosis gene a)-related kinase 1/4/5